MSCMMKPTKWTVCEICDYRSFEMSQKLIFCAGLFLVGGGSIFYGWIFTLYRHDLHVDPLGAGWALWSRRHLRFLTPSRSAQTFPANGPSFSPLQAHLVSWYLVEKGILELSALSRADEGEQTGQNCGRPRHI